jgi:hypothetical protein
MNAAPLCFGPRARDLERGSDFGPSGAQPNRVGAAFATSPTVALSAARGSMSAMTGAGHAANSIELFHINYWLDLLFVHRLDGNRCRTKNGIFEAISGFGCYIPRLSGEQPLKTSQSVSFECRRTALLQEHKFQIGQTVYFTSRPIGHMVANSTYEVVKLLPSDGADYQYRIKNANEVFERVARESQLEFSR